MENDFLRPAKSDNLAPPNIWNSWFSLPTIQLFVWKREKEKKVIPRPLWLKERQRVFNGKVFQVESFKVTSLVIFFSTAFKKQPRYLMLLSQRVCFYFRPLRFFAEIFFDWFTLTHFRIIFVIFLIDIIIPANSKLIKRKVRKHETVYNFR